MGKGDADERSDATLEVILLTEKLNFASIDGEANAGDWYLQLVVLVRLEGSTTYIGVLRGRDYELMPGFPASSRSLLQTQLSIQHSPRGSIGKVGA